MIITEAALTRLEKAGWVVTAGLWTAEGHQVFLRRESEEQIVTVASKPFIAGRRLARVLKKTTVGCGTRRRLGAEFDQAMASSMGRDREDFLRGMWAGVGSEKSKGLCAVASDADGVVIVKAGPRDPGEPIKYPRSWGAPPRINGGAR